MRSLQVIVIAIVASAALCQRANRVSQSSSLPQRPQAFLGASPVPVSGRVAIRQPIQRTRISGAPRRRAPPAQQQFVIPVTPATAAPPAFTNEDFEYFDQTGFQDTDYVISNQPEIPSQSFQTLAPQTFRPTFPSFSPPSTLAPVPVTAQFQPLTRGSSQAVSRVQNVNPRRTQPIELQQDFGVDGQQEEQVRGRKEPEVKIIKSWSTRNADGTFSYGYINTDGSFKNETKGIDCVVRGIYGYVDETTGERLSFPYESGNPCDPNEPDYFYDYEAGTINDGRDNQPSAPAQRPVDTAPLPRRRAQQLF